MWIYSGEYNFDNDSNNNGIICDVKWTVDSEGNRIIEIYADSNVDEDPDDEKYLVRI